MKIEVINRSEKEVEACDYHAAIQIIINGKTVLNVSDGEPEDANLSRDFSDVYSVPGLLEAAYKAGKDGESFELTEVDSDEI